MTTLVDVARRAGVSKSTVSNVIRGDVRVAKETRDKVERAIADTNYHPNAIARSLKAQSSTALGIVVPDLTNPFFAELAAGVERSGHDLGYAALITHTECSAATEEEAGRTFIERRVDGVIIGGMSIGSPLPALLLDNDIPVVAASFGESDDARLGVVDQDDPGAMEAVVDHLYRLGHRRLAFISPRLSEQSGERRRLGFEAALARRGLSASRLDEGATAVAAHNDMMAIETIDGLERQGRRVPEDVSVVGFDDIPLAAHWRINLTTVRSDAAEMGRRAVELVVGAAADGRHVAHREVQKNSLVLRATTARAPR